MTLTPAPASEVRVPVFSAWWVLIAGVAGLAASMALTVEKFELLIDPHYVPSCNINPIVSCGSVMTTPQAAVLGFPNPLLGIIGFTVVLVTGVLTVSKVALPQWYWIGLSIGTLVGVVLVHWLIFQSLYRIGALCPYCMVVWAVSVPLLVVLMTNVFRPVLDRGDSTLARVVIPMALVDRHTVVHRGAFDDHGEVLGLLVDALVSQRR